MNQPTAVPIVDRPAYTPAEVGRLLLLPPATVRAWFFGVASSSFKEVLKPADAAHRLLSFGNLCEAHVLATIRRVYNVPMPKVRNAIRSLVMQDDFVDKPLLNHGLLAERGRTLLLNTEEALVDVGRDGQIVLRDIVERAVARIVWDARDLPVRLFPFSGRKLAEETSTAIAIDPEIGFGRPILVRASVSTAIVFDRFGAGDKIEELAADFEVSTADIEEAIRFESRLAA